MAHVQPVRARVPRRRAVRAGVCVLEDVLGTAGFAHVSCLAEQAKILFDEAEENNLDLKVKNQRWLRWSVSGRPTYVFQHAHPSAHATAPWYFCSHRLHLRQRSNL